VQKISYAILTVLTIAVIGLALAITVPRFMNLKANEVRIIDVSYLRATAEIAETLTPSENVIGLSLHTDKTCYFVNEPIHSWINLANLSNRSTRVLKTLRFFTGNEFQNATPLVNGIPSKAQVLAIDDKSPTGADDYATLLPSESVTTYIPNFLDLVSSEKFQIGQYRLSIAYKNLLYGVLNQIILTSDSIKYELLVDQSVWTGAIVTNEVTITIVDDSKKCLTDSKSEDMVAFPVPTRSWSR
jgi:hypothetical protein